MTLKQKNTVVVCVHLDDVLADVVKEALLGFQAQVMRFKVRDALAYLDTHPVTVLLIDLDNLPPSQAHLDNLLFMLTAKIPTLFLLENTSHLTHPALPAQKLYLMKPVTPEVLQREISTLLPLAAAPDSVALDSFEISRLEFFNSKE